MDLNKIIGEYVSCNILNQKYGIAEKFLRILKGFKIIIYGAGAAGTSLLSALRQNGMEPDFFVDRRYRECHSVNGIKVCPPEMLAAVSSENAIVILAINAEVIRIFRKEPFENIKKFNPAIEVLPIGADVISILKFVHCHRRLQNNGRFNLTECLDCGGETRLCDIYQQYLYKIAVGHKTLADRKSKKFDWFGYIMGQYCSLKCKDCCEHVPYYKNPVFSKRETIISDCQKIAASCEFIRYIELVGGEPFLHPDFKEVLEGLLQIENVGYVKIFTNGTVVPKEEILRILENNRIVVDLSNYTSQATGRLLENIYETMEKLKEHNIRYVYSESKEWTDWGDFHDRGRSEQELAYNFEHCFCANCHRVFQGILYRCPHQYAGIQRGLMGYTEGEYIDLNAHDYDTLAQKLDAFEELKFTDGCRRCDMPFDCPVVPAGLQL